MTHYVKVFTWDGKLVNPPAAQRIGMEIKARLKGAEDEQLRAKVKLGHFVLACMENFGWSQRQTAGHVAVHRTQVNHAVRLCQEIGDASGELDMDKLAPVLNADGSLPNVITVLRHFRIRVDGDDGGLAGGRDNPNKVAAHVATRNGVAPRNGLPAGSVLGQGRTAWRQDGGADTEQTGTGQSGPGEYPPAELVSLSPPGAGRHGTRAAPPRSIVSSPETPVGGGEAGRPSPRPHAGTHAGTPGGVQLTMDALYAGAVSDAERLLAVLGELLDRVGLDAGKVGAAKLCFEDGLGYLREAGGARGGVKNRGSSVTNGRPG